MVLYKMAKENKPSMTSLGRDKLKPSGKGVRAPDASKLKRRQKQREFQAAVMKPTKERAKEKLKGVIPKTKKDSKKPPTKDQLAKVGPKKDKKPKPKNESKPKPKSESKPKPKPKPKQESAKPKKRRGLSRRAKGGLAAAGVLGAGALGYHAYKKHQQRQEAQR